MTKDLIDKMTDDEVREVAVWVAIDVPYGPSRKIAVRALRDASVPELRAFLRGAVAGRSWR